MTGKEQVKQSKFLGNGLQLICDARLANMMGRSCPIFLQHLYFSLTDKKKSFGKDLFHDERKWIYNTYDEWKIRLGGIYSVSTIRRMVYKLEKMGILLSCQPDKKKGSNKKYYTIDFDALKRLQLQLSGNSEVIQSSAKKDENSPFEQSSNLTDFEQMGKEASVQNEQILTESNSISSISSITSGEEVSNKPVKQPYAKPPRKEKTSNPEVKESRLTEANKVIYQLIEIYNKHVGGEKVILNKRLSKWLMAAFQKLGSCLKKWENFCKRIATSDWLMGRVTDGFKATLSWLLRFEVMDRVLAGGFKCKEPYEEAPIPTQEDEREIIKQIENSELSSEEQSVKKTLLKTFGITRFKSYFSQLKIKLEEGKLTLLVKSLFHRDQIDNPTMWGKIMVLYPNAAMKVES